MHRFFIPVILATIVGVAPAWAERDPTDWRSLMRSSGHLKGSPDAGSGVPLLAPPVVVAPANGVGSGRPALPGACLVGLDTPDGWRRIYDGTCLADHHAVRMPLPAICRASLVTWGDVVEGYDPRCLERAGYPTAF